MDNSATGKLTYLTDRTALFGKRVCTSVQPVWFSLQFEASAVKRRRTLHIVLSCADSGIMVAR
jgi:hypothetical protein